MDNAMRSHLVAGDLSVETLDRYAFLNEVNTEILCAEINLRVVIETEIENIIDLLGSIMKEMRVKSYGQRSCCVKGTYCDTPAFVEIWTSMGRRAVTSDVAKEITLYIYGDRKVIREVPVFLEKKLEQQHLALVKWWHNGSSRGPDARTVFLPPLKTKLHPEFYPDISNPSEYLKQYLASEASILMLSGPPGTGKTTLLRHLICENKLAAHVVYDEQLMSNDAVFQSFLFGEDGDIMIIEDADTIITSRERDNNKLMARFLNVSDGLIKLPNKKLVFTTNISDFNKVDTALLRPGRCFGILHTRALNLTEAQAAAKVAGLAIPIEKKEYTLGDLFNEGPKHKVRAIGFLPIGLPMTNGDR